MRIFPTSRFYYSGIGIALLLFASYFFPGTIILAKVMTLAFFTSVLVDIYVLFRMGKLELMRELPERFSNGDANEIKLTIRSLYPWIVAVRLIDEIPDQFQQRDLEIPFLLDAGEEKNNQYTLSPKERGVYQFGCTNTLISTVLGLVERRQVFGEKQDVKVYPSFLNIEKYELAAISQNLKMGGQKRMRKVGQSQEFDHIKEYVLGDDPRYINWKASARRSSLMVNHYIDEKSQPVYCVIDKGRAMKMPFEGMTLLDYSINASLILSNIAMKKGDRAGLITFQHRPDTFIPAQSRNLQINLLLEALYKQKTAFNETDFSSLFTFTKHKVPQRSLMLLFTNFESIYSLERQLSYLKLINRQHLLMVIFFKNSELEELIKEPATKSRAVYDKSIAKQLMDEKRAIKNLLHRNGILSLYTRPQNLKVDVINKYIEIKTKRLL